MNLLENKKIFIFDLDGTIWEGQTLLPGALKVVETLKSMRKQIIYLTNNASKSRESFLKKLIALGINSSVNEIMSSGYISSIMLAQKPEIRTVFVIGSLELINMIESKGTNTLNRLHNQDILYSKYLDKNIIADAVLTSWDMEFTYAKIRTAMELINRGAEFFATNGDVSFPKKGQLWPGGGVMLAAVQACTGKNPKEIFGKPNINSLQYILEKLAPYGTTLEDMVLIGDRLDTDILQANQMGITSILVETGVNKVSDIEKLKIIPTKVIPTLNELH
jgi:4-nitrophenyl phosphatase